MSLSKRTLQLIFELGAPPDKMAELLHAIDADMAAFTPPATTPQSFFSVDGAGRVVPRWPQSVETASAPSALPPWMGRDW